MKVMQSGGAVVQEQTTGYETALDSSMNPNSIEEVGCSSSDHGENGEREKTGSVESSNSSGGSRL